MALSKDDSISCLLDGNISSDEEEANFEVFVKLLSAVKAYNSDKMKEIFKNVPNKTDIISKQYKDYKENTLIHVALRNIKAYTNSKKANDVIKCLIENGARVDLKNSKGETPFNLLQKQSKRVTSFNWTAIRTIFSLTQNGPDGNNYNISVENTVDMQNCNKLDSPEFLKSKNVSKNHSALQLSKKKLLVDDQSVPKANKKLKINKVELTPSSTSQLMQPTYTHSPGPKMTLHGYTYQLKLIMLFVQGIPEGQEFYLATEMKEAKMFDDIVLKYQENGVWKHRFLQAKHKHEDDCKLSDGQQFYFESEMDDVEHVKDMDKPKGEIKIKDLFNINEKQQKEKQQKRKPYFLKSYFNSFCDIKNNPFFHNSNLEEFLICTNIDFSEEAKPYFEQIEEKEDPILKFPAVKYQISNVKVQELKKQLKITSEKENDFEYFIHKFRFLVNFGDNVISKLINESLKEFLNIKNIDLATTYMQYRLLNWFESYRDNQSEYLTIKDKNMFLDTLQNIIRSLSIAGYSSLYADELKSYGIVFENLSPFLESDLLNGNGLSVLVTLSPKLSTIKLCQIFGNLKIMRDEVIFVSLSKFNTHKEFLTSFCCDPTYKWLVIECERGEKVDKVLFDNPAIANGEKNIIIVGQEEDVVNLSKKRFYDLNCSFKDLEKCSQVQLLKRQVIFQGETVNLDQLININSAEYIIDDPILEKLIKLDSKFEIGDINNCVENYYISRILCEKQVEPENKHALSGKIFEEDDLSKEEILNNKVMLIANDPGFGKSTYLTRVAHQLKKIRPDIWVLRIDLASHAYKNSKQKLPQNNEKFLEDISFMETDLEASIEFLNDMCIPSKYDSQEKTISSKIFIESLRNVENYENKYPTIILLFDGFDEISPNLKDKTLILLKALKNLNVAQMWITTRVNEEVSLENNFNTSALRLKSIYSTEKSKFLIKFWKHNLKHDQQNLSNQLQLTAEGVLKDLDDNKLSGFSNNPLHLYMLAEVIFQNIIVPNKFADLKNIKLFFLYEKFINIKLNKIFRDDKDAGGSSLAGREFFDGNLGIFRECHRNIAFKILFPHNVIQEARYKINLEKAGLLTRHRDRLQFVHRSFAEYFVCEYLAKNFHSENIQKLIFQQVLFNDDYQLIRTFLNDNPLFLKKFSCKSPGITTIIEEIRPISQLYKIAEESNYNLITSYLKIMPVDISKEAIFFSCNENEETILHSFCRRVEKEEDLVALFSLVKSTLLDNTLIKELIFNKTKDQKTVFQLTAGKSCAKKFKALLDFFKLHFDDDVILNLILETDDLGNNALHQACLENSNRVAICILEAVKDKPEILKDLLITNQEGDNVLHCIFSNAFLDDFETKNLTLQTILNFFKSHFHSQILEDLLLQSNNKGNTVLHVACVSHSHQCITGLIEAVKNNPQVTTDIFLKINEKGRNVLNCIFSVELNYHGNDLKRIISTLQVLLDFLTLHCDSKLFYDLLLQCDNEGNTVLHYACMSYLSECVISLVNAVKDNPQLIKDMFLKVNKNKQTSMHCIFFNYKPEQTSSKRPLLKTILDFHDVTSMMRHMLLTAKLHLNSKIFHNLLLKGDNRGYTALHYACLVDPNIIVADLLEAVKDSPEVFRELLLKTNGKGKNALHCIFIKRYARYLSCKMLGLQVVLRFVGNSKLLEDLLLQADKQGNTVLHYACMARSNQAITCLIEAVEGNTDVLNKMILKTNCNRETALHCTILTYTNQFEEGSKEDVIKELLDLVRRHCSLEILHSFLLQTDNKGYTALHMACEKILKEVDDFRLRIDSNKTSYISSFTILLDFIKVRCPEILWKILCKIVNTRTILHIICNRIHMENKKNEGEEEEERVKKYDVVEEYNALAEEIKRGMLSYLLDTIKNDAELLNEILLNADEHGQTALLYTVTNFSNPAMLEVLFNFVKINCKPEILRTLLSKSDAKGCTVLHYACRANKIILTYLLNTLEDLDETILTDFILKKNIREQTALEYALCNFGKEKVPKEFLDFWTKHT